MLTEKSLAQNEYIELVSPNRVRSAVASIATKSTTNAGATFVIQVEGCSGEFISIGLFNAITQLAANNLTGASQYGWTDVPGNLKVRATRTDANGGDGTVGLSIVDSGR